MKHPRTVHLPQTQTAQTDDIVSGDEKFKDKYVIVTEKMDGQNVTMYSDRIHARSLSSKPLDDLTNGYWANYIKHLIPENYALVGESLTYKHSIHYQNLESFFMFFFLRVGDMVMSHDTLLTFQKCVNDTYGIDIFHTVPVLYEGIYDYGKIKKAWDSLEHESEGFVVRTAGSFPVSEFSENVSKFVRTNHVQTDKHWMHSEKVLNKYKNPMETFK